MSGAGSSTTTMAVAPVTRRVRAYFAPVNRATSVPTIFDAAQSGSFSLDAPPAPWVDLGWCSGFARKAGTKVEALRLGAPATASSQVRTVVDATVSLEFESWGKLQLALASGSQQMNLLNTATGAAENGSGGRCGGGGCAEYGIDCDALNVGTDGCGAVLCRESGRSGCGLFSTGGLRRKRSECWICAAALRCWKRRKLCAPGDVERGAGDRSWEWGTAAGCSSAGGRAGDGG